LGIADSNFPAFATASEPAHVNPSVFTPTQKLEHQGLPSIQIAGSLMWSGYITSVGKRRPPTLEGAPRAIRIARARHDRTCGTGTLHRDAGVSR
jgi:hypothetical protein